MRALLSCVFIILREFDCKMSPLVLGEILGLFLNTLTADGKYPLADWENWQLPMQMQLSGKRKTFSQFFNPFLETTSNLKHFEEKDTGHR